MRFSRHFEEHSLVLRPFLQREWCERVLASPIRVEQQANGRFRHWGFIEELGRYLPVVTEADWETVVTAFPDRRFKEVGP